MTALSDIPGLLEAHRPRRTPGRRWMTRCGVAVLLDEAPDEGLRVLLMRRAKRAGDPWSGDMSFPGGRMSAGDGTPQVTAIRETAEEIGLTIHAADCLGRMSDVMTRKHEHWRPMIVTPYVFRLSGQVLNERELNLNHEAVEVIQVPLTYFAAADNRQKMHWRTGRVTWEMPCYYYQDCRIWGLTLFMLRELIHIVHGTRWRAARLYWGEPPAGVIERRP